MPNLSGRNFTTDGIEDERLIFAGADAVFFTNFFAA